MISDAKADANRRNAQQSTGPRTEEGKARSSQNGRTHGLTAAQLIVPEEERGALQELEDALRQELRPQGCLEQLYFVQIVHAQWQLHKCRTIEAQKDLAASSDEPALNRIDRYSRRHQAVLNRALDDLRKLQTNREIAAVTLREEVIERVSIVADARAVAAAWKAGKAANPTNQTHQTASQPVEDPPVSVN